MKTKLSINGRWHVPFQDTEFWRVGIYRPEFDRPDAINRLERHSCPELFVCQIAPMGLLIIDDSGVRAVYEFKPGDALLVTSWHNGFYLSSDGYFLVVERTEFTTEYREYQYLTLDR